jgi:hypothetical protein
MPTSCRLAPSLYGKARLRPRAERIKAGIEQGMQQVMQSEAGA